MALALALSRPVNETIEEEEEEFRSCCGDEDELKEREENSKKDLDVNVDGNYVKMYFKGVSVCGPGDGGIRTSGIGVVIQSSGDGNSPILVQKKLDFYVEESVVDYLALMDGLSVAIKNGVRRVFAFTDSQVLCDQITSDEDLENPLQWALKERILEQASNLENFNLKFLPAVELQKAVKLAQVAVGIVCFHPKGEKVTEMCSICCEEKLLSMVVNMNCSHKFCSQCMRAYVEDKIKSTQVPIKCPQSKCNCCISAVQCKSFLTVSSYEALEKLLIEANILDSNKIYCTYHDCSVMLDLRECVPCAANDSSDWDYGILECPACERSICANCGVAWHDSLTCEEYQNMPLAEREAFDLRLRCMGRNTKMRRRCHQCHRFVRRPHGSFRMTCRCDHEFCYSCGLDYKNGEKTCQCAFDLDEYLEDEIENYPPQQYEQWAWESFMSLPSSDTYSEQERSQLALIQRFLSGGFSSTADHQPYQSPPRCTDSYMDTMKDLRQLPWLERFVSVISDNYYEEYVQ